MLNSPAKGAYGLKPVSRVRIPPSPPAALRGYILKSKQRLSEYGLFLIYPYHLPLVGVLPRLGVSGVVIEHSEQVSEDARGSRF